VCEDVDWIIPAQDRVKRWTALNNVIKIRVPQKMGYLLIDKLVVHEWGLRPIQLAQAITILTYAAVDLF